MRSFIDSAITKYESRKAVPFAIVDRLSGTAIGSTRYHFIEPDQRRLEIGVTWISPAYQRSHVKPKRNFFNFGMRSSDFLADVSNSRRMPTVQIAQYDCSPWRERGGLLPQTHDLICSIWATSVWPS
ncbi:GNAT family N-acetyltransferase [Cupriavidus sp. D39]|uniref:GNAT family N-acetyltransferase n=1 Tax=Cupriavidus sp. D39 TaxID=2997877 RepID=UPI003B63432A